MESVERIREFLTLPGSGSGSGYGDGDGSGSGDGSGYDDGSGDGYGYGSGSGSGYDDGSGDGYGYGSGSGSGYGDGYGYGSGSGYGDGSGYGYGDGSGDGSGYGDGSGSGDGSGYGDGYGDGSGYGDIKKFDGVDVYLVDEVPTIFDSIKGDYACGHIIRDDLTLQPCYIAKRGNFFAHGDTLHNAVEDAEEKALEDTPLEDRISDFVKGHPDLDTPYGDLFKWHHILTGSCEMGRLEWCKAHGYKPTDSITVREFIEKTAGNYGGEIIQQLKKHYDEI